MTGTIEGLDAAPVRLARGEGRADSALQRLRIAGKPFFVLRQRGAFADICYDHGRLLAPEIDRGPLPEIVSAIARGIDRDSATVERIGAVIYHCYSDRLFRNCGAEFRAATEALIDGYLAHGGAGRFSRDDVRDAIIAIEVGNLVDGLGRVLQIPYARVRALLGLLILALPYLFDRGVVTRLAHLRKRGIRQSLARTVDNLASPRNRWAASCTGFCAGGAFTADGRHLHARNFDADLYQWNVAPVLSLIDETPADAGWRRYVAFGAAGVIYPGGISGINDAGIAVSLHQLSTTRYRSGFLFGTGAIAPFLQQRILREAKTLDEAVDVARSVRRFAAWTVFCSNARSGEGARIEFNGARLRVTRESRPMAQSNHFLHPDLVERAFDASDGHFTPSFGKWLETRARLDLVRGALAAAAPERAIDLDWAIELLASSEDAELRAVVEGDGGRGWSRSFGRVPRKTYGQLASIVRGDPERRAGHDEVWMTTGDRQPGCQGTFAGWRVTWEPFDVAPVADRPLRRAATPTAQGRADWERSLSRYVDACIAVTRPRGADGGLLRRDPTPEEHGAALARAETALDDAIALAARDRIVEVPYHYMRARIRHERGRHAAAREDWTLLRDIWARQNGQDGIGATWPVEDPAEPPRLHPYEAALTHILWVATEDALRGAADWPGRADGLALARDLLGRLESGRYGGGPAHFDLAKWRKLADRIEKEGGQAVELPDESFITVE